MIMRNIDRSSGISIGGIVINDVRSVDNTVIIAEPEGVLEQLMDIVFHHESFIMVFSRSTDITSCNITVYVID